MKQLAQVRSVGVPVPGHHAPVVGPEAPFEMLEACHERVQRSLQLLHRLIDHLQNKGHDASAALAASDVLRYFKVAAPLHHQDEELHVFPPLLALQDAQVTAVVEQLLSDHRAMEQAWIPAAQVLDMVAAPTSLPWQALDAAQLLQLQHFAGLYTAHIALEESLVYPKARESLSAAALQAMSADMVARRSAR